MALRTATDPKLRYMQRHGRRLFLYRASPPSSGEATDVQVRAKIVDFRLSAPAASKGSRNGFRPSGFLEAWGSKAQKPHIFRKVVFFWPCRLRRQGQTTIIFWNKCGFWALVPRRPKNTWPTKPLRDPSDPQPPPHACLAHALTKQSPSASARSLPASDRAGGWSRP